MDWEPIETAPTDGTVVWVLDEIYAVQRDDWEARAAMAGEHMVSKPVALARALGLLQRYVNEQPVAQTREVEVLASARAELEQLCAELAALRAHAEAVGCGGDKSGTLRVVTDSWNEQ